MLTAAVTGTNGKTTVVELFRQIMEAAGRSAAGLGSLGLVTHTGREPEPPLKRGPRGLPRMQQTLRSQRIEVFGFEAYSAALAAGLVDGVKVDIAAFTNFSPDHLEVHGDLDGYWAAKQRLFSDILRSRGTAILNVSEPRAAGLGRLCRARGVSVLRVGPEDDVELRCATSLADTKVKVRLFGRSVSSNVAFADRINQTNCAMAIALAHVCGLDHEEIAAALPKLRPPPGRLEPVAEWNGARIYIDYAHNPGGLAAALQALRPESDGRLTVVFGCGGHRLRSERPAMGEIASRHADRVIITDDNSRYEDPALIRGQIREGCPESEEIPSRKRAIAAALGRLEPGDVIVVCGKGDEVGNVRLEQRSGTSDRALIAAALAARSDPGSR